jgi:cytosine/adenosine deaminase-related metal-dependent hydrolase
MTSKFLLRGGIVLVHDKHDHVIPMRSDLLVEGNKIIKIEKSIKVDASVSIIDCTNKIISPGFVDTHHHLWQTQLKGRHGNESLLDYIYSGEFYPLH